MAHSPRRYNFQGMMAPTFVPLHPDGSLNTSLIKRYAQLLHEGGVKGAFVNGTLGEGASLSLGERKRVAEAWLGCTDMVGHVVVQVGGASLADARELASHASQLGATAIACLPPLYDRPSPFTAADLVAYCSEVAKAAPKTPLLYYHIPSRTGVNVPMDEFLSEAAVAIPTLSGLKFTSNDVEGEGARCLKVAESSMAVFTGYDQTMTTGRRLGVSGVINGCVNFMALEAGRLFCLASQTCDCCMSKQEKEQEINRLQQRIDKPWEIIAAHSNGSSVSGAKAVMRLLTGLEVGPARLPQRPLTDHQLACLKADLQKSGYPVSETHYTH